MTSIKEISSNTVDIHQTIEKGDNGFTYTAFFDLGGVFLDTTYSPEKFSSAEYLVIRIAQKASDNKLAELGATENKNL